MKPLPNQQTLNLQRDATARISSTTWPRSDAWSAGKPRSVRATGFTGAHRAGVDLRRRSRGREGRHDHGRRPPPRDSVARDSGRVITITTSRRWKQAPLADIRGKMAGGRGRHTRQRQRPKITFGTGSPTAARASAWQPACRALECFEFDNRDTYDDFLEAAIEAGLGDLVDRMRTGI